MEIKVEGELPLYKSYQFEQGIKTWMKSQMLHREREFKAALQRAEREIMRSFAFKKEISYALGLAGNITAHSTLSELMYLEDDFIVISFNTDFHSEDLSD